MRMWSPNVRKINIKPGSELMRRSGLGLEMMLGEMSYEFPYVFQTFCRVSLNFREDLGNNSAQTLGFEIKPASVFPDTKPWLSHGFGDGDCKIFRMKLGGLTVFSIPLAHSSHGNIAAGRVVP